LYHSLLHSQGRATAWKIIGQQVIVNHLEYHDSKNFNVNYDAWDGYQANRRRLFDTIQANKIDNVVFLSGDSHAN
jgi:alkaline phosphatase D